MQKKAIIAVLLLFTLSLYGCASYRQFKTTKENLKMVELGMSKGDVISIMGTPKDVEVLLIESGVIVEFLKYQISYDIGGPLLHFDTTPICIENGEVVGWGWKFYKIKKREIEFIYP